MSKILFNFLQLLIFLIFFLQPHRLQNSDFPKWVIWNVGQGSWSTWVQHDLCLHFDMGGLFAPIYKIYRSCEGKLNILYLTHTDWDHMRFIYKFKRLLPICYMPLSFKEHNYRKQKLLNSLVSCDCLLKSICKKSNIPLQGSSKQSKFSFLTKYPTPLWRKKINNLVDIIVHSYILQKKIYFLNTHRTKNVAANFSTTSNDLSQIYLLKKKILIFGDSSFKAEKLWASFLNNLSQAEYLLVGHHGSRYSTHTSILKKLPGLKMAIASAKKSFYGHPHPLVQRRLKDHGIPLISTEIWGNIHIQIKPR